MRIQVKDFMSSPVATAVVEKKVGYIRELMERKRIHAVPIVQYTKQLPQSQVTIKGIVTATDLSKNVDDQTPVQEIMTSKIHIIHKDTSAKAAAKMMLKRKIHHLVVMAEGKVVGMISSLDFVTLVAEYNLS